MAIQNNRIYRKRLEIDKKYYLTDMLDSIKLYRILRDRGFSGNHRINYSENSENSDTVVFTQDIPEEDIPEEDIEEEYYKRRRIFCANVINFKYEFIKKEEFSV